MPKPSLADTISKEPGMINTLGTAGFRNLLASTTVAAFGGSVSTVAVSWIVYYFTHNAIYIAYLGIAGVIPGIVFGLFAGVIADRYDRKLLMVSSDVVRTVSMAFLSIFLFFIGFSFPLILAIMVVVNTFTTIFSPASQAILPMIVSKEKLENANGLLQGSASVFQSVGSAAGGLVVAYLGAFWGLGINSMTYALSAIFLFQIIGEFKGRNNSDQSKRGSFSSELVEGMGYMKQHIPILELTLGSLPANFFASLIGPFLVVYASVKFGTSSASYGYLVASLAGGMAIGSILVGRIKASRYAGMLMAIGLFLSGIGIIFLALSDDLYFSLMIGSITGLVLGLINTTYFSTMQAIVPIELLARVLSIDSVGSFAAIPAGLAVGGLLISAHGIVFAYLVAGTGLLINGFIVISMKGFRSVKYVR